MYCLVYKTEHCKDIPLYIGLQFYKKKSKVSKAVVYCTILSSLKVSSAPNKDKKFRNYILAVTGKDLK